MATPLHNYDVKVIAASQHDGSPHKLITLQLLYPRFIHAELMTHRVFARNASSSRAIPIKKMIQAIRDNPATPLFWGRNQPGMVAEEEIDPPAKALAEVWWTDAMFDMISIVEKLDGIGVHKQTANRLLEPFQLMRTVVTATDWDNFICLRCHSAAQPEFRHLAQLMRDAIDDTRFTTLPPGAWHTPYYPLHTTEDMASALASAARCARVSYLNHDGEVPSLEEDLKLANRLARDGHMSPFEHVARPLLFQEQATHIFANGDKASGPLRGWQQLRHAM